MNISGLKVASYFTEPICKVREYFYSLYILDETCGSTAEKISKAALLVLGIAVCVLLTPFTAPIGALIRCVVIAVSSKPYAYLNKKGTGKVLPEDKKITVVSHNQCYVTAGYAITDGQVTPGRSRMKDNIQKVKALDPDIICLYEVQDICDADYISSKLPEYPFIIPVAGPRAIGPSSMMFVASKYQIAKKSISFVPFVKGVEVTGRAQYSEKGFLSFDIVSHGSKDPFATIISTHLQHSEIPTMPNDEERDSRKKQLNKISNQIQAKSNLGHAVVLTGDLNLEEPELNAFLDNSNIDLRRDPAVVGQVTWGGDKWCSDLMGKPFSNPLVLDYTMIAGKASEISTQILGTGYSSFEFRPKATSDHNLLLSTITIA